MNIRIGIFAKGIRGKHTIKALLDSNVKVEFVLDQSCDRDLKQICNTYSISYYSEVSSSSIDLFNLINNHEVTLLLLAGYSKILKKDFYESIDKGVLNCHGGKLPNYRGASPIPWQIIMGENQGACYILGLSDDIDGGPIYASREYRILPQDNATTITSMVSTLIAEMFVEVIQQMISGRIIVPTHQDVSKGAYWTRRYEADGNILWNRSNQAIINLIRGLTSPYPGAFTYRNTEKIIINKAMFNSRTIKGVPGRYVGKTDQGIIVCTGETSIIINEVVVEGKCLKSINMNLKYGETFQNFGIN